MVRISSNARERHHKGINRCPLQMLSTIRICSRNVILRLNYIVRYRSQTLVRGPNSN